MTKELKNLYEELIEDMIMDGIDGMTSELKNMIQNSPTEQKRSMILTIMEENNPEHRLLCSRIQKVLSDGKSSEMKHIKEVVKMLREYVEVSDTEVKTMGEVMTPISLVEEMLDTLPDNVWSNPSLRWLDPCNGVGTFVSVIVERLMKGLSTFEPDEKKRYEHIMENMIYVCELQSKNVFLYMYAFDPKNEYDLNIYNGSFLDDGFDNHMNQFTVLDEIQFDIVVMNPPYQELKEGNKKSQALWDKFVIKVLEKTLVKDGYLVAVHPDGWKNVYGMFKNVQLLLRNRQILYLEMHNFRDGIKTFGAATTYDFYCVRNTENLGNFNTKIKCTDGKIERADISKMEYIPNGMFSEIQKIMAKDGEKRVNILYSRTLYGIDKPNMSKEKTDEFKYPCIYTTVKDGSINFWYSNTNTRGHFGIPKVIWSNGYSTTPIVDSKGEYGLTQFSSAIVDDVENLERIKKALETPEFIKIMRPVDDGCTHKYNYKAISLFRKDFWVDFLKL
jgi:hypothetical protein